MKITVTQRNIDEAVHHNPECCPIALAVKDVINDDVYVLVDGQFVWTYPPNKCYKLTNEAKDFVINFDSGRLVRPIEFEL